MKAQHTLIRTCQTCEQVFVTEEQNQIYCPACEPIECRGCSATIYRDETTTKIDDEDYCECCAREFDSYEDWQDEWKSHYYRGLM